MIPEHHRFPASSGFCSVSSMWFVRVTSILVQLMVLFFVLSNQVQGFGRRKAQFTTEPAHLLLPSAYNIPGLGGGLKLVGLGTNMFETMTDTYVVAMRGALEGAILLIGLWAPTHAGSAPNFAGT